MILNNLLTTDILNLKQYPYKKLIMISFHFIIIYLKNEQINYFKSNLYYASKILQIIRVSII